MLKYFLVMLFLWHIFAKCITVGVAAGAEDTRTAGRGKRQKRVVPALLFPRTSPTRVQWIIGVGIPLEELVFEAMTTGYVIKAEYYLPWNAEQLRNKTTQNIARHNDDESSNNNNPNFNSVISDWKQNLRQTMHASKKALSSYRWAVYKALEHLAIKMGLAGRICVLKSICESAELNLHVANGLFGELLHILLTPSSSVDELSVHADNEYFQAEYMGRSGADCNRLFKDCPQSLLDRFSDIYTFTEDLGKLTGLNDLLNAIQ